MSYPYFFGNHQDWGINNYVPAMTGSSRINKDGLYSVSLGTPNVADTDGILDGVAADDSGPYTYTPANFAAAGGLASGEVDSNGVFLLAPFGRALSAVGSAAGVTQDLTVVGYDYLGQKVTKTIAMNGTTPIAINVAFKRILSITIAVGASGETIDVGFAALLGVPYKTTRVINEELAGVLSATLGTVTAPVLTDPATAATLDPRGLYTPNATLNGSSELFCTFQASAFVNASGNGGLHGIRHYTA